jgi:hypothetical protein
MRCALTRLRRRHAQAGYVGDAVVRACAHGSADVDVELLLPVRARNTRELRAGAAALRGP